MYLIRNETDLSLANVGATFSKDHTAVIHGINLIKKKIATNKEVGQAYYIIAEIMKEFKPGKATKAFDYKSGLTIRSVDNTTEMFLGLSKREQIDCRRIAADYRQTLMENYMRLGVISQLNHKI